MSFLTNLNNMGKSNTGGGNSSGGQGLKLGG